MFDAIVVGARCAGAPLAMLLARRGYRVLAVDKAHFPSDTVSTHVIWQAGLARAKRWGLLDGIRALGAPPFRTVRIDAGAFDIAGAPPPLDGVDFAMAPRRTVLDKFLVDAAREAGAEVREGFHVSDIVMDGGRVVGIRGNGTEERARIVIGADGAHSYVAHAVKAERYHERPSASGAWYAYWEGEPALDEFVIYIRDGYGGGAFPTNDGQTCIVAAWSHSMPIPKAPPDEGYRMFLESGPLMERFLRTGRQVTPLRGTPEQPGWFRKPYGDGWALAGDAAYHKHPLSAQGITDAFRDADELTDAIDAGLSGRRPMDEALADYQRRHDEAVMPMYESTYQRAMMAPPPPEVIALFEALRSNQAECDRFMGTDAGTVPIPEFFSAENMGRIMGGHTKGAPA